MLYPAIKALGADTKKPALGGAGVLGPFASSVKVVAGARNCLDLLVADLGFAS